MSIGLIGCGAVAEQMHLPALLKRTDATLAAVVDRSLERRNQLAALSSAKPFATVEEALSHFDAAIVALPHSLHAPVTITLLKANKHVLVEKPMALNPEQCDAMLAAARESKGTLTIGHMRRFIPAIRLARDFLRLGLIGEVTGFDFEEGFPYSWPVTSDSFFRKESAGGGVLFDMGSHTMDGLLWLLGPAEPISYRDDAHGGVEADCEAFLRLSSGVKGRVALSRLRNLRNSWLIRGTKGVLEVFPGSSELRLQLEGTAPYYTRVGNKDHLVENVFAELFVEQLDDWLGAIKTGRPSACPAEEGKAVVELMDRMYRMAKRETPDWFASPGAIGVKEATR